MAELESIPLSAVIIAKNAASILVPCLKSLQFADEVLLLDGGSDDDTVNTAKRMNARVIVKHDWSGFGKQKQFAVEQARHNWVLCLDADERVSDTLRDSIQNVLKNPVSASRPNCFAYEMPRRNRFMGRWLRHGEGYPDFSLRMFHQEHARWSEDAVHERVVPKASTGRLQGDLLHESEQGLEAYLNKQSRYTTLQAETLITGGMQVGWRHLLFNPIVRFIKFYIFRLGFLDGVPGLIHIVIGCFNTFIKYAKAWSRQSSSNHNM